MPIKHDSEASFSCSQVFAWRLERSRLGADKGKTVAEVAADLLGVQAQVMSSAETALCLRTKNTKPSDVRQALWQDRSLIKTWTARGTLHLLDPKDLPLFVAAMKARGDYWDKPSWAKYHGINAEEMAAILDAMDEALEGAPYTRKELAERLGRLTKLPHLAEHIMGSWGSTIKPPAFHGKLIFGPSEGRNITFVSPSDWSGAVAEIPTDQALKQLALRYISTYGPSTRDDFSKWLGAESKIGRQAMILAEPELVPVDLEGQEAWCRPEDIESVKMSKPSGRVVLLPAFDPYVVGVLSHVGRLAPSPTFRAAISRTAGWISATVVKDGRIVGTWTHKRRAKGVDIDIEYFIKQTKTVEHAANAARDEMAALMAGASDAPAE